MRKREVVIVIVCLLVGFFLGFFLQCIAARAYDFSAEEIVLMGKVVQHEAENQSELGKRLVVDTILNRLDSDEFPNTVEEVINQEGQYCNPKDYPSKIVYRLVAEEICNRTNDQVLWFKRGGYHSYGEPLFQEDDHYFSGLVVDK